MFPNSILLSLKSSSGSGNVYQTMIALLISSSS